MEKRSGEAAVSIFFMLQRTEWLGHDRLNRDIIKGVVQQHPDHKRIFDARTQMLVSRKRWVALNVAPYSWYEFLYNFLHPEAFAQAHRFPGGEVPVSFVNQSVRLSEKVRHQIVLFASPSLLNGALAVGYVAYLNLSNQLLRLSSIESRIRWEVFISTFTFLALALWRAKSVHARFHYEINLHAKNDDLLMSLGLPARRLRLAA